MQKEGIENISIRKIADRIEYSPAIIYHYFQDKDDIINHLMKTGYSLFPGASGKKPALKILFQCLKDIYKDNTIDDNLLELTAQVIAAATFGLITRLILEKDLVSEEQKEKLIEHYIKCIVEGMVLGQPLYGAHRGKVL